MTSIISLPRLGLKQSLHMGRKPSGGTPTPPVTPPTNTVLPSISGTLASGQTLTLNDGTWTGSPTFARQWYADGVAISGATGQTFVQTDSQVGKNITAVVIGTNSGGSAQATTVAVGPVLPNLPFTYDPNIFFWDFKSSQNIQDTNGITTLGIAAELVGNKARAINQNKAQQPLVISGGINCNQGTNRRLIFENQPTITNGKQGLYFATAITFNTTTSTIMQISGPATTVATRFFFDFTGSRNLRLRYGAGDSTSLTTVFTSAQLTLGIKYAIELFFDISTNTISLWINGVLQTLTITGSPFTAFPASNPLQVIFFNTSAGGNSLDGPVDNIAFYDGVIPSNIRSSISAFEQTRQAA